MKPKNYKYKLYVGSNYVRCEGSYAGKKVYATAKCHPDDEFDIEKGKKLAELRCAEKIAIKRVKYARNKVAEANAIYRDAQAYAAEMDSYLFSSIRELTEIIAEKEKFEKTL